jgi:hypothetical protein
LIGAGIAAVITLCVNSFGNQGWTLPPLAATGWLILGTISSPLLGRTFRRARHNSAGGGATDL